MTSTYFRRFAFETWTGIWSEEAFETLIKRHCSVVDHFLKKTLIFKYPCNTIPQKSSTPATSRPHFPTTIQIKQIQIPELNKEMSIPSGWFIFISSSTQREKDHETLKNLSSFYKNHINTRPWDSFVRLLGYEIFDQHSNYYNW